MILKRIAAAALFVAGRGKFASATTGEEVLTYASSQARLGGYVEIAYEVGLGQEVEVEIFKSDCVTRFSGESIVDSSPQTSRLQTNITRDTLRFGYNLFWSNLVDTDVFNLDTWALDICHKAHLVSAPNVTVVQNLSIDIELEPQGAVAGSFGDVHVVTFDDLKFDCQAAGIFTTLTSLHDSDFKIQERFTAVISDCSQASVSTGVAVTDTGKPTIQISTPGPGENSMNTVNECPIDFYVDGTESFIGVVDLAASHVFVRQYERYQGEHRIKIIHANTMLTIDIDVLQSEKFGCHFIVKVGLPDTYRTGETLLGLLGTPNGDMTDDWVTSTGDSIAVPPAEVDRLFATAYDYCVANWCVTSETDSLFTLRSGEAFVDINQCDVVYSGDIEDNLRGLIDNRSTNQRLYDVCTSTTSYSSSDLLLACVVDGLCGDQIEDPSVYNTYINANNAISGAVSVRSRREQALESNFSPLDDSLPWKIKAEVSPMDPDGFTPVLSPDDGFGWSVAVSGETMIVGSYHSAEYDYGTQSFNPGQGSARVFKRVGTSPNLSWEQVAVLIVDDQANPSSEYYGYHVALDGSTALISAIREDSGDKVAKVFVFELLANDVWEQTAILPFPVDVLDDGRIPRAALEGGIAVVGAGFSGQGIVYVFDKLQSWTLVDSLEASDGQDGDYFGSDVSISGNTILVGASQQDLKEDRFGQQIPATRRRGKAYFFVLNGGSWVEEAVIEPSAWANQYLQFGASVSLDNNTAFIGNLDGGEVYVYEFVFGAWTLGQILNQRTIFASGQSVQVKGDLAIVSNHYNGEAALLVKKRSGWTLKSILSPACFPYVSRQGNNVAIGTDFAVLAFDNGYTQEGAVHVFDDFSIVPPGPEWIELGWSEGDFYVTPGDLIEIYLAYSHGYPQEVKLEFFQKDCVSTVPASLVINTTDYFEDPCFNKRDIYYNMVFDPKKLEGSAIHNQTTGGIEICAVASLVGSPSVLIPKVLIIPFFEPRASPSIAPSIAPSTSIVPSTSIAPSTSLSPSVAPSTLPSWAPSTSLSPSFAPSTSSSPSLAPSVTSSPSFAPSLAPSTSTVPSLTPSATPFPSVAPSLAGSSALPSSSPSGMCEPKEIDLLFNETSNSSTVAELFLQYTAGLACDVQLELYGPDCETVVPQNMFTIQSDEHRYSSNKDDHGFWTRFNPDIIVESDFHNLATGNIEVCAIARLVDSPDVYVQNLYMIPFFAPGPKEIDLLFNETSNSSTVAELFLQYTAGHTRDVQLELYGPDCETAIPQSMFTTQSDEHRYSSNKDVHGFWTQFNPDLVEGSDFHNLATGNIEVCAIARLVDSPDVYVQNLYMIPFFEPREITLGFNNWYINSIWGSLYFEFITEIDIEIQVDLFAGNCSTPFADVIWGTYSWSFDGGTNWEGENPSSIYSTFHRSVVWFSTDQSWSPTVAASVIHNQTTWELEICAKASLVDNPDVTVKHVFKTPFFVGAPPGEADIIFEEFSREWGTDVRVQYLIGRDRAYTHQVLQKDCQTLIDDMSISTYENWGIDVIDWDYERVSLYVYLEPSMIRNSVIFDPQTSKVEFCHVVTLTEFTDVVSTQVITLESNGLADIVYNWFWSWRNNVEFEYLIRQDLGGIRTQLLQKDCLTVVDEYITRQNSWSWAFDWEHNSNSYRYTLDSRILESVVFNSATSEIELCHVVTVDGAVVDAQVVNIFVPAPGNFGGNFGDPHIMTFDGLSYDCNAAGEFTTLTSKEDPSFKIQERFTMIESGCGQASVSTGVVVSDTNKPKIQISTPRQGGNSLNTVKGCPIDFYVDGISLPLGTDHSRSNIDVALDEAANRISIKHTDTSLALNVTISKSDSFGCHIMVQTSLPGDFHKGETLLGLLGTPNGDKDDDWRMPNGTKLPVPTSDAERLFSKAYNYCVDNWCARTVSESLFTHGAGDSFDAINKCDDLFNDQVEKAVEDKERLDSALVDTCGESLVCLVDGLCGDIDDARAALSNEEAILGIQAELKGSIFPLERVKGLNSKPVTITTTSSTAAAIGSGTSSNKWYPNWGNTEQTCKNDGNYQPYMETGNYFKKTLEDCCNAHYWWAVNECMVLGGGTSSQAASGEFYVDYESESCKQSCFEKDSSATKNCGGLAPTWMQTFKTAEDCCTTKLFWMNKEACVAASTLTNLADSDKGLKKWYVDWISFKCVKDCVEGTGEHCGGIAELWDKTVDTVEECCTTYLPWVSECDA